jgi:hypothetical protein
MPQYRFTIPTRRKKICLDRKNQIPVLMPCIRPPFPSADQDACASSSGLSHRVRLSASVAALGVHPAAWGAAASAVSFTVAKALIRPSRRGCGSWGAAASAVSFTVAKALIHPSSRGCGSCYGWLGLVPAEEIGDAPTGGGGKLRSTWPGRSLPVQLRPP